MRLLLLILLLPLVAEAAELNPLKRRVDVWLDSRFPELVERQATYFAANGRYWQGLLTHSVIPAHSSGQNADSVADQLSLTPTDQSESWLDFFPEWANFHHPAAVRIISYDGPSGHGWVLTIFIRHNGVISSRTVQMGPEDYRNTDWHIVTEE